jgi:putative membrane protein
VTTVAHPSDAGTSLAIERTWLAHERTMMAWVRTATSLISFGFTIYKFFQLDLRNRGAAADPLIGPREFALFMIGIGLVALILASVDHRRSLKKMRQTFGVDGGRSTAGLVGGLVSLLGLIAILAVIFRQ